MPEVTSDITIGGDFSPLEREALNVHRRVQALFSRDLLRGSSFSRPLGEITGATNEFSKSMAAANARVVAFGATTAVIFQVSKSIKELVASTVEVDKALTEINVLFNKSQEELANFSSEIFKIAKDTGQSFGQIAEGATELARQGLGAEDTLLRLRDASILSRQSGLDLEDSVTSLTAAINSFSQSSLTSTQIINKFANVDQAFAVSSKDLAEALKRVGSTAQDAGVGIDELIGLVTSAQQTTSRGGAVIGNALKTIFTRIERPQVIAQLDELGIAVKDAQGALLPTTQILKNFAVTFQDASESQQSYLAELVGSVYQINILKALLGDLSKGYGVAAQATDKSAAAQNEAIKRNEEYNKSLSATLNRARETFRQIGSEIGNLTIAPVIGTTTNVIDTLFGDVGSNSESLGSKIGEGIFKGIGNFLSGPGLLALTAVFGKLAFKLASFAGEAAQDFFNLNKSVKEQEALQIELKGVLSAFPELQQAIINKTLTQVELEKALLTHAKERLAIQAQINDSTKAAAANFLRAGQLGFDKKGNITPRPSAAAGFVPNEKADLKISEIVGAIEGGYQPGEVRTMTIPGIGPIVYNSNEQVKDFGMDQPAILPPHNSKAGQNYKKEFKDTHGFDPYFETPRSYAEGLLPKKNKTAISKEQNNAKLLIDSLGKAFAFNETDAIDFKIDKTTTKIDRTKLLKLNDVSEVQNLYLKYPEAKEELDSFAEAAVSGDKRKQAKLIRNASKKVRRALAKEGYEGIEVPINTGNSSGKVYIDTKNAAEGFIPNYSPSLHGLRIGIDRAFQTKASHAIRDVMQRDRLSESDLRDIAAFFQNPVLDQSRIIRSDPSRLGVPGEQEIEYIVPSKGEQGIRGIRLKLAVNPNQLDKTRLITILPRHGLAASQGLIPNYNKKLGYGPLYKAVQREKESGAPESSIRIGRDKSLVTPQNPQGLGVYNTFDEPQGLVQGIDRAVNMGLNPKTHGIYSDGAIPNYAPDFTADPKNFQPFTPIEKRQKLNQSIDELIGKINLGDLSFEQIPKVVNELAQSFKLTIKGSNSLQQVLSQTATSFNANQKKITRPDFNLDYGLFSQIENRPTAPKRQLEFQTLINEVNKGRTQVQDQSLLEAFTTPTPGDKKIVQQQYNKEVNSLLNTKPTPQPSSDQFDFTYLPTSYNARLKIEETKKAREAAERDALLERQTTRSKFLINKGFEPTFLQEQFSFKNQNINNLGGAGVINKLISQFSGQIVSGELGDSKKIKEATVKFRKLLETNVETLGGTASDFAQVNRITNDIVGISRKLRSEVLKGQEGFNEKRDRELLQRQVASTASFQSLNPFNTQARADARALKAKDEAAFVAARAQLNEKISRAGFAASIGIPIVAGAASEFFSDKTQTSRGLSAAVQGAGNVASYAALGATVGGGLPGLAVGGGLGLALELPKVIKAFNDNLPDLIKNFELASSQFNRTRESLDKYINLEDKLINARNLSGKQLNELKEQTDQAFNSLPPEIRKKVSEASTFEEKNKIIQAGKKIGAIEVSSKDFAKTFGGNEPFDITKEVKSKLKPGEEGGVPFFVPQQVRERAQQQFLNAANAEAYGLLRDKDAAIADAKFFSPESNAKFANFVSFLSSIPFGEKGDKSIFTQSDKELTSLRDKISQNINDPKELANVLKEVVGKAFINDESKNTIRETLTNFFERNPVLATGFTERLSRENLTDKKIEEAKNNRVSIENARVTRIKTESDFASVLFKATEALNNFTISLENSTKSVLQDLEFQKNRNSILVEGFTKRKENFVGPKATLDLKTNAELLDIRSKQSLDVSKINSSFALEFNKILNSSVIKELDNAIKRALPTSEGDQDLKSGKDITRKAFNEIAPIVDLNEKIQAAFSGGDFEAASKNISELGDLLAKRQTEIAPKINEFGTSEEAARLKEFLATLGTELNTVALQRSQALSVANEDATQQRENARLRNLEETRQLEQQKRISFGGGVQNILNNPNSFRTSLSQGQLLGSLGDLFNDRSLAARGNFQKAETLQSLGVDIKKSSPQLFESLIDDLETVLDKIVTESNITLNEPTRVIASAQIGNAFKTESDTQALIGIQNRVYEQLAINSDSLKNLLALARSEGFNVNIKNVQDLANAVLKDDSKAKISREQRIDAREPILNFNRDLSKPFDPNAPRTLKNIAGTKNETLDKLLSFDLNSVKPIDRNIIENPFKFQIAGTPNKLKDADFLPKGNVTLLDAKVNQSRVNSNLGNEEINNLTIAGLTQQINGGGRLNERQLAKSIGFQQNVANTKDFDLNTIKTINDAFNDRNQLESKLFGISKDVNSVRNRSQESLKKEITLLEKVEVGELSILDAIRKKRAEDERIISLEARGAYNRGDLSGRNLNKQLQTEAEAKIDSRDFSIKDAGKLFVSELTAYNNKDFFSDIKDGAISTAGTIKSEFSEAFSSVILGTKSAGSAFKDFGLGILNQITKITTDISTKLLFNTIGDIAGSVFGSKTGSSISSYFKNQGGIVGYSSGGEVRGGSGIKDDVPAKLTKGEYVIKRSSAQSIGIENLRKLNRQGRNALYGVGNNLAKLPSGKRLTPDFFASQTTIEKSGRNSFSTVLNNSFVYNDAKRPTGGYFNVSSQLSSLGQTDEDNPSNREKFQREESLISYLRSKAAYDKRARETLTAFKRRQEQAIYAAYIQAGVTVAGGTYQAYRNSGANQGIKSNYYDFNQNYGSNYRNNVSAGGLATYSGFKRFAKGGYTFGGDSSQDKIKALLTGGEFVITKPTVDKYGVDFFNRLNAGKLTRKDLPRFAEGGYVGQSQINRSIDSSGDSMSSALKQLSETTLALRDSLNASSKPSQAAPKTAERSNGEITNNITITVHVDSNNKTRESQNSSSNDEQGSSQVNNKKLAEAIRQNVLKTIVEEQRNGGLLAKNS